MKNLKIREKRKKKDQLFELAIDGNNVFKSTSGMLLEASVYSSSWLNTKNPNPTLKGSCRLPDETREIVVSRNYAYVANDDSGLQIIDISDPSFPIPEGSYITPDRVEGVAVLGNYAYIAASSSGLQIIDISDPANPTFKGSYDTTGFSEEIAIFGNSAYMIDSYFSERTLKIIDIKDPANPILKGSYNWPATYEFNAMALSPYYAYITSNDYNYTSTSLLTIDIRNPSTPTLKGLYNLPDLAFGITIFGNYAYVADGDSGLQIIDISDPSNPTFKSSYYMSDSALDVVVSGNSFASVANSFSGLQIIDIRDPANPKFKCSYSPSETFYAERLAVSDNYAYILDEWGLNIISSNLDKLELSGTPYLATTDNVEIDAWNEVGEYASDSFQIFVENLPTPNPIDLTIPLLIIGSITCAICTTSFCCLLIGGGIVRINLYRKKNRKTNAKELKMEGEDVESNTLKKSLLKAKLEEENIQE